MEKKDNLVTVSKPSTLETPAISSPNVQYMQTNERSATKSNAVIRSRGSLKNGGYALI
jgi:hypothetical protein